ncbi:sortase [Paenibacillus sp. PL91]|uniref:sortase n=1 Tax=Paenibacillus sp. PL91 TaxID=2729538 RepID=UPI00174ACEE0|nr:sortase [Paenibacillus sp. PL91]
MKKIWSYSLVIVGILILLYPKANEWNDNRQQNKLMEEWEEASYDVIPQEQAQEQYEQLTDLFNEELTAATAQPTSTPTEAPTAAPTVQKIASIATLKIDKIKLKLPVVEGATQKNMKSATAHLKETSAIGEVGNAAIAGHRMRSKGRLFNRLGEIEVGDKIVVETKEQTYTYTVYKVSIVEPTDVSVLNYNNKDKLLTLITCDPIVNPTHRLIIHAKM